LIFNPGKTTTRFVFNINILLSDLREPYSEHTNDEDSAVYDFCNKTSNEGNILDVFAVFDDVPSQEIFKAFNPIDLSSAQIELPLLNKHTNGVVDVLFVCFSKACRMLLILLTSSYDKKNINTFHLYIYIIYIYIYFYIHIGIIPLYL